MKKKFFMYVMMLFAVVMGSVVFSSCGDDDDSDLDDNDTPSNVGKSVVGKWKLEVGSADNYYVVFEFKSNGTGKGVEYERINNRWTVEDEWEFTWVYNSETCRLTLIYKDNDEVEKFDVEWITNNKVLIDGDLFVRQ